MRTKMFASRMIMLLLLLPCNVLAQNLMDNNMPLQGQQEGLGRPATGNQGNRPSRVPPHFAIDACKSKSEGTACEFTGHNGIKQGVCVYTPDNKYFACRPNDMKMRPPPQQQ